jgi:hypothetical protein
MQEPDFRLTAFFMNCSSFSRPTFLIPDWLELYRLATGLRYRFRLKGQSGTRVAPERGQIGVQFCSAGDGKSTGAMDGPGVRDAPGGKQFVLFLGMIPENSMEELNGGVHWPNAIPADCQVRQSAGMVYVEEVFG